MEKILLKKESVMGRRIGAFFVDYFLISMIIMIPSMLILNKSSEDSSVLMPIVMLIAFTGILFKDIYHGKSLGKFVFGIYVAGYEIEGEIPKFYNLILRNITLFIWPIEFFILMTDKEGRRLGDKIAKTKVIGYRSENKHKTVITAVVTISLIVAFFTMGISLIIKNDASYKTAIQYIETQNDILSFVGEIQGYGFFPSGEVNYTNNYGNALLRIKVHGDKNSMTIIVYLTKKPNSDWVVNNIKY